MSTAWWKGLPGRAKRPDRSMSGPFCSSVRLEDGTLIVQHRTGEGGSIRVEEILQLFGLGMQDLAGPVRRTNVVWETTERKDTSKEPCMETRAEDIEDAT